MDNIINVTMEEFNLLEKAFGDIRIYENLEHSILVFYSNTCTLYFSKIIDQNKKITKE